MNVSLRHLSTLLGKRSDDPAILALLDDEGAKIERVDHWAYAGLEGLGLEIVFVEAEYLSPQFEVADARTLYVDCFHLHSEGHEGYAQYAGEFPERVSFGDSESRIVAKLGQPIARGGGGWNDVLEAPVPKWIRYMLGPWIMHFHFDGTGRMEMVSLFGHNPRH